MSPTWPQPTGPPTTTILRTERNGVDHLMRRIPCFGGSEQFHCREDRVGIAGVGAGMEHGERLMGERVMFVPLGLNLRGDLHSFESTDARSCPDPHN